MLLNRGCKRIKRLLVDYLENSLGESHAKLKKEEVQLVKGHLLKCHECLSYHDNLKEVLEKVRLLKDPELPDSFWANYVTNFRKRLEEESTLERNILPEYRPIPWQLKLPRLAGSIALFILLIGIAFSIYLPKKMKYTLPGETPDVEGYVWVHNGEGDLLDELEENPEAKEYLTMNIAYEISSISGDLPYENGEIEPLLDKLSEEEKDVLRVNLLRELRS